MSAVPAEAAASDVDSRLAFFKNLQVVTNKVHATANIDEIMLELSGEICSLFNADRLTIYSIGEDKASIVSKIKTGLTSFKDLRLPIADQSIAGHVALAKKTVNIRDVYDDAELKAINPDVLIPMHCSGETFVSMVQQEMPDKFIRSSTGTRFTFAA